MFKQRVIWTRIIVHLRNEFDIWNVHVIMNTSGLMQSKWNPGFAFAFQKGIKLHIFPENLKKS